MIAPLQRENLRCILTGESADTANHFTPFTQGQPFLHLLTGAVMRDIAVEQYLNDMD